MIKELMAGFMSLVLVAGLAGMVTAQTPDDLELRAEYLFDSGNPMADSSGNGFDVVGVGSAATVGEAVEIIRGEPQGQVDGTLQK